MANKVAFINNKGGSTKTTTTVNLAGALCKDYPNLKILIVEGDAQGNASASFGIKSSELETTIYDVFMGSATMEDAIVNAFQNIDIIPANSDMNFLEFDIMEQYEEELNVSTFNIIKELDKLNTDFSKLTFEQFSNMTTNTVSPTARYFNMLEGKIDGIDNKYDVIFFDTPPELKAVTSSILAICDETIIPFEPDLYAVDGITNIVSRVETIKEKYNENLKVSGILATKVKKNTKLHTDVRNSIMKYCMRNKFVYFESEIPNSIRFASSTAYKGLPLTLTKRDNDFVSAYFNLLEEIIDHDIVSIDRNGGNN